MGLIYKGGGTAADSDSSKCGFCDSATAITTGPSVDEAFSYRNGRSHPTNSTRRNHFNIFVQFIFAFLFFYKNHKRSLTNFIFHIFPLGGELFHWRREWGGEHISQIKNISTKNKYIYKRKQIYEFKNIIFIIFFIRYYIY